jgi:2-dehydro-3-deoxygalactonokinase
MQFIGIDWGSTNFRAYLIDKQGEVLAKKQASCGMLTLQPQEFAETLRSQIGDWLDTHANIPIIMAGMVGARQGWVEAEYLHCPVQLGQLSKLLTKVDFDKQHEAYIVPGLAVTQGGDPDVMRGEETQLFGAMSKDSKHDIFCMPGTHSKWVVVENYAVQTFRTYMTGELFSLLEKHSILSKQISEHINEDVFYEGIEHAKRYRGLLSDLFKIRSATLLGQRDQELTYSYLSGLLIGYEVMESRDYWQSVEEVPTYIVANEPIASWYLKALNDFGFSRGSTIDPEQAVVAGLTKIYNTL